MLTLKSIAYTQNYSRSLEDQKMDRLFDSDPFFSLLVRLWNENKALRHLLQSKNIPIENENDNQIDKTNPEL